MGRKTSRSKTRSLKTRKKLILMGLVAALAVIILLEITNTTYLFHEEKTEAPVTSGAGSLDKGMNSSSSPSPQPQNQPTDNKSTGSNPSPAPTSSTPPKTPYGNFVSSHHIPLSAGEQSACNTTPGASCTITFSKDGVSKSLPAKTVDNNGSAIWSHWTPSEIGLGAGSWKIVATATLNDQKVNAEDHDPLEVQ
jgi:hypothetical protein